MRLSQLLLLFLMILWSGLAGCAAAYHDYRECRVPCTYCVPPALPFPHYPTCVCHSRPAERHQVADR